MSVIHEENRERQAHAPASVMPAPDASIPAALAATALLAACGGGGTDASQGNAAGATDDVKPLSAADVDAARFLQQAQFSATRAEIAEVRQAGYAPWLAQQFEAAQAPGGWDWLEARGYGQVDANRYFANTYPADFMLWSQLMSGPQAMRRRMALALSELLVVSLESSPFNWCSHAFAHYWDTLVKNAFGNFRQLLEDVTLHPAMGYYLNTRGNQKENASTGRVPDENYAREVMQLFTIGLHQLNPDGTDKPGASGSPLETYTSSEVSSLARVFTGYDFDRSDGVRLAVPGQTTTIESRDFTRKPMAFNASQHSTLEASFLGVTIPANTPGPAALKTALDTLFNHPNAGPFFARQMIQRLVTSNPSAAYVGRVADQFNNNGAGVRGDLRAVWAAILLDDEARSAQSMANLHFGKLREPMLRLIQWARSFGVTSAAGSWKVFSTSSPATQLGQSPLRAPSVFNFFRPGFVPPNTAMAAAQAPAPEFQLLNETTVGAYLNYMQGVIRNGISCPQPDVPQAASTNYLFDVKARYDEEMPLVANAGALVSHLGLVLCAGALSAATQTLIVSVLNATPLTAASTDAARLDRIAAAVLMVMASADYLIQK
ncbi:MAG: DUF1800 domain-containing protein [Pseudomonadota bacterium]|nr:DUF1800 domain-containing protein [Pseudomonadota bacterium]